MAEPPADKDKTREELLFEIAQLRQQLELVSKFPKDEQAATGPAELGYLRKVQTLYMAMRPDKDLETLMQSVIETVRRMFDADHVALVHPCTGEPGPRRVPFSCVRGSDSPLVDPNMDLAFDEETARTNRMLLARRTPVALYLSGPNRVPSGVRERHGPLSVLAVTLHPVEGDPWLLTLHQCSFERQWTKEEHHLLDDVAQIATSTLSNVLLRRTLEDSKKRLQNLSAQLFRSGEEDRKQFAREIHDDLGQPLVAIKVGLDNALYDLDDSAPAGLRRWLVTAAGLAKSLVDRVRMMQDAMYPAALQDFGPLVALDAFLSTYRQLYPGLDVNKVVLVQEGDIPDSLGTILFRIVQEALYNAAKHSGCTTVSVALEKRDNRLRLAIRDDGKGFDLDSTGPKPNSLSGLGLPSMRERTEISGGSFSIHSSPGKGTFIQIEWPLDELSERQASGGLRG